MISDEIEMIREAADRLFADHADRAVIAGAEAGTWPDALWTAASDAGLVHASVGEAAGGAAIPIADGLSLAGIAAEYALPVPIGETILASWLLDRAGLAVPPGPLTFAALDAEGVAARVPWGRSAGFVAVTGGRIVLVDAAAISVMPGLSMAGEPRDTLTVDVAAITGPSAPSPVTAADLRMLGAALRSIQIAGALRRTVTLATHYARQRVQFGKALSQFQAIQQSLAVLATQASVATAAAEMATRAVGQGAMMPAVAIAKARCGEAAGIGSAIAHQIHGAIGFTLEHDLQLSTRRLLSWRDEFGNEAEWNTATGRQFAATGGDALWHRITDV